ncbi:PREDICTED: dof zinc finger protein DOF4.6-like [Camelina sativa]|uniref:Dof zinc finger protein DOF4.6-like n=1 Tax=Camelina sativa TaxID=90675 RepID=A0ABM0URS4_CAMSA|nr:PREDICTED: dof zinc finger protein DOF4.6-like [Camelina sativa]XP_010445158.2 PREDICTED: dof zinc finger protein DOF4.6-like [Camelina sativa]
MSMSQQGLTGQNPKFLETTQQDLNLGFPPHGMIRTNFTDLIHNIGNNSNNTNKSHNNNNPLLVSSCSAMATSSLDLIRNNSNNGNSSSSSFMGFPVHNQDPTSGGFSMQDHYKPCNTNTTLLGFSLDHHHNNGFHGGFQGGEGGGEGGDDDVNGRHLFPFEDLKLPVSSSSASVSVDINDHQKRGSSGGDAAATSGGYWTGMLSGGSWC